jgi:hypothetical protein
MKDIAAFLVQSISNSTRVAEGVTDLKTSQVIIDETVALTKTYLTILVKQARLSDKIEFDKLLDEINQQATLSKEKFLIKNTNLEVYNTHSWLDTFNVPRKVNGEELSIIDRIQKVLIQEICYKQ